MVRKKAEKALEEYRREIWLKRQTGRQRDVQKEAERRSKKETETFKKFS